MIFLNAQPDIPYYHWQVEVQIYNFLCLGVDPKKMHIIFQCQHESEGLKLLRKHYPEINFFSYADERLDKSYISSIRPHVLAKHFEAYPELENEVIFYHDCDIIFYKLPDFEELCKGEKWYLSDTNSYINADYIKSKSELIFDRMCKIVGVKVEEIEAINEHSGGAQYLMKNVTAGFWHKVEYDSVELYKYMTSSIPFFKAKWEHENKDKFDFLDDKPTYHEIQAWCADMWAVLWNAVFFDNQVEVVDSLKFSWATSNQKEYERCNIYHNAGVSPNLVEFSKLFFKGQYQQIAPWECDLSHVSEDFGCYNYVQEILATKKFITENFSF